MRFILGNRFQRRNTEKDDTHSTGVSNTPVLPGFAVRTLGSEAKDPTVSQLPQRLHRG